MVDLSLILIDCVIRVAGQQSSTVRPYHEEILSKTTL
jgi:hypothetical protein